MTTALTEFAPEPSPRRGTFVLSVELAAAGGERWRAIGAGETLEDAFAWALESAPLGPRWP